MKRHLTESEIADILSCIIINPYIPRISAESIVESSKRSIERSLRSKEIYPEEIPKLKQLIKKQYMATLVKPGSCVGIITAQSIGEKQTQSNLNTFHKAGSSEKQPTVSKFNELMNLTNKPKAPYYIIHLKENNDSIAHVREAIKSKLVQLNLKKLAKSHTINISKKPEAWYDSYCVLYNREIKYTDCISIQIDMDIMYEYRITLAELANALETYADIECVFSPDCFAQIDIFVDMGSIVLPSGMKDLHFITEDNIREIYLEEVVYPELEHTILFGVHGVNAMFFLKEKSKDNKDVWFVETENSYDKTHLIKYKKLDKTPKTIDRFKKLLSLDFVDATRTLSNNIFDIYITFGIEAMRAYMIQEFSNIMKGINNCHVSTLVDKMTYLGYPASITRYTMRDERNSVLSRAAFEESIENLASACVIGQKDPINSLSASIICGKRVPIGTGMNDYFIDLDKLKSQ